MTHSKPPAVRVRFAPSPTGLLHIGGLRTALYNYCFARHHDGQFILRIEDTDRQRYVSDAEPDILASLRWMGISYDEGPEEGGPFGPYYQSERKTLYDQYAQQLISKGHAYYAFDSTDEIAAMRERLTIGGEKAPKYDVRTRMQMGNSLTLPEDEVKERLKAGVPFVVRLKVPENEIIRFKDKIRGWVSFESEGLDDQVLVKSDGLPTYHLANVVDDHLMGITHVIRGEEWLPSTPKHILLYQFLGWTAPRMAHIPLILSPAGGKLSKRNAEKTGIPVSVKTYRDLGYEPSALLNFLALLGWNPGTEQEIFSLDELVRSFTLERVGSSGVQFNLDKLRWYNQQYLRALSVEELSNRTRPFLDQRGFTADEIYLQDVLQLMKERITFVEDLVWEYDYFFTDPVSYDETGVKKRWKADSADLVKQLAGRIESCPVLDKSSAETQIRTLAKERDIGAGRIIHAARLAVSGVTHGPGVFELLAVLGKERCAHRLCKAADILG